MKIFDVVQQLPFLLSLFKARNNKLIKLSEQKKVILFIEKFHFMFTAVCSLRPSGLQGSYSVAARELQSTSDRQNAQKILERLKENLSNRLPDENIFIDKFKNLKYYNGHTKDKKLIQYIFTVIEKKKRATNELVPENLSLEHILSQSKGDKKIIGQIGNLLPLGQNLNVKCDNKSVDEKLEIYKESEYFLPKEFYREYPGEWNNELIEKRTERLAKYCYHDVWEV